MQAKENVAKEIEGELDTQATTAKQHAHSVDELEKALIKTHKAQEYMVSGKAGSLDRWLVKTMLEFAGNPPLSVRIWDGSIIEINSEQHKSLLTINDRAAMIKLILEPELFFGDLYSSGRIEYDGDLVKLCESIYTSIDEPRENHLWSKITRWLSNRRIVNSLSASRDNIYHHYDISNDFYKLWLDTEAMQYTCAYFPDPELTIEQAQVAKLHHVCRKLQLQPGDKVVEAGCGWGGLARFMAKHYGVTVKAYNISHAQVQYARQQAEKEGLSDKVEYIEDDYRNIKGKFDVFVSVGMLEHVGDKHYMVLGDVIQRCLKKDGRGLIHSIGRVSPKPMNAWIERRIFPGAYPPSLQEMMNIFEPHNLEEQDVENLRLHYAKTLEHWLSRFEYNIDTIKEMLGEEFIRTWRLYLAGSIAAFTTGELQLFQILFNRQGYNKLPWSRAYMYAGN
ncbi:MAG: cyclopropane-fatty-acyl-phospholipid synthase [Gammaproteobacteria bacterium]